MVDISWAEKYRPNTLDDVVFDTEEDKNLIKKIIDDSEDGIEIKIDDRVLIKNILISDANLIKDLVRKEY